MRPELPTGRIALLLTDIEGSTRLLHRLGAEGYARAQAEHRTLLRDAFRARGGVEVDTQGDAFFYVFPTPRQCVDGAVAGTRALAGHGWAHGEPVKVRMGIHCGEPQPTDEGYVGMVVNTTARVAAIGHGGQILLSADAADEVGSRLDDLTLKDLGNHRLKDLDTPQRLYQVVIPELPADFPPPRSAESVPNNLPSSLTPFIGRAALVADLHDLMVSPNTRAITLLGPGGSGKSRLGLELARELLPSFDGGAWFVGLAATRDPALVVPAIASALGVKEEPGRELQATLAEYLAGPRTLLLLDNFEQVHEAAREVGALLARCPGVKLIATSRQPLRLKGERRVPVPPMTLPPADADFAAIAASEAVRLFVETAEEACWDFQLDADNAPAVVEICRRVDALPLAIELATAKLATLSVDELLDALEDRLGVLTEGSVDLLDHQQTLRDLIAWSYDLLNDAEQRLWRRLAVFSGGATLEAVASVCDPDGVYRFPRDIDSLVTKSLVNLEFGSFPDSTRTGDKRAVMLETLHEFAAEALNGTAEADPLRTAHLHWYRQLAETAAEALRGPDTDIWLARLDQDLNNLRAAMAWGFSGSDPESAAGIVGAIWFYFYERGLFQEGVAWLERALAAPVSPRARARACLGLANLERTRGKPEAARAHGEVALATFRELGDELGTADALARLGVILQYSGEMTLSEQYLTEAVDRLRPLGQHSLLAFALTALGATRHIRGDLQSAGRDYAESLGLGRELGDRNAIATALVNLGELKLQLGERDAAAPLLAESLHIYHGLGVRNAVAYCLEMLAGIALADGEFERAATLFGVAGRLRELLDAPVESFNQERYQRDIERARDGAGEACFAAAWQLGSTMSLEEAVSFAALEPAPGREEA